MRLESIIILVAALALPLPSHGAGELLRCAALDSAALTDDGKLSRDEGSALAERTYYENFIIDLRTGVLRRPNSEAQTWVRMQKGSGANDHVFSATSFTAQTGTDILRVRQWSEKPRITFLLWGLSTMTTGNCEAVQ